MRKLLALIIAVFSLLAVIVQFELMLANRVSTVMETTIRFFSFFTILTNSLVAGYFSYLTYKSYQRTEIIQSNFGTLTALTVYITIVGLVYQILLRQIWNPVGLQKIVDEMLHSLNPALVIIYWSLNRKNITLKYRQIGRWLVYPLVYLIYVLIRGYFSNFYPYPFLNVTDIGLQGIVVNSLGISLLFVIISILFVWISKLTTTAKTG